MTVLRTYERFTCAPAYVLNVTDRFAWLRSGQTAISPATGAIGFSVTRRLQPSMVPFDPPLDLVSWRNSGGFFVCSGETRAAGDPTARELPPGTYRIRIDSDYYLPATIDLAWPPAEVYAANAQHDVALDPGADYPFPNPTLKPRAMSVTRLRGSLFQRDGSPSAGVAVSLTAPALPNPFRLFNGVTDARGNWAVAILQTQPVGQLPDFGHSTIHVASAAPYDVMLALTPGAAGVRRQTALRGRVVTPAGRPIAGATIATSAAPGLSTASASGDWFFYFDLGQAAGPVTVTATAPNGHLNQQATQIVAESTVVVPTITIA
jgi:hypothetical protein